MEKKLKYPIITISRQYGAYGHTIADGLSERLGIPYYDKDFVKETAKASGYTEEEIEKEGEDMSRSSKLLNSILNNDAVYPSSFDKIFQAQKEVVLKLAQTPCIIVGRCAECILKEEEIPCFRIFLYADKDVRVKHAAELPENAGSDIDFEKLVSKMDSTRETYYKQYTGTQMGNYHNYNISLDVGVIGVEKCIDIICGILEG